MTLRFTFKDGSTQSVDGAVVIGRDPDRVGWNAIALPGESFLASKNHLTVESIGGDVTLTDLGSTNGTSLIVGDKHLPLDPMHATSVALPCTVDLGNHPVRVEHEVVLETAADPDSYETVRRSPTPSAPVPPTTPAATPRPTLAPVSLTVRDLTVETHGVRRLDAVDLDLASGSFLALLGTSGAGKSTLLKALTGVEPATGGTIRFDDADLYDDFETVRSRIGYVPQDDILHPQLTVRETLDFASRLRFGPDTEEAARTARITEVLDELGIAHRADAAVDELSGGQRKRVNVAVELLTQPSLLILDEPTSGLDPGNERLIMELLRNLADGGRIVIVVTHSIESLHLCDTVLFLAPGGVPVYCGPPAALPSSLGAAGYTDVFPTVERLSDPSAMRVPRRTHGPLAARAPSVTVQPSVVERIRAADPEELGRQFRILTERYLRVLIADRRSLIILAAQAPVIALLMLLVFGSGHLAGNGRPEAGNVLMALSLATIYLGASNAVREIVKERPILRREQNFGLSIVAYIGSKFAVLGVLTLAQAGLLVVTGVLRQNGPGDALVIGQAIIELMVVVGVCGLSALALGLLISAWASSGDKAMTMLPVMLFAQFLMAGLIFPVSTIGVQQASWFMSARWGFSGSASIADFWTARGCGIPQPDGELPDCSTLWQHEFPNLLLSYVMLLLLTGAALVGAWAAIVRNDPVRVLARAGAGSALPGAPFRNPTA